MIGVVASVGTPPHFASGSFVDQNRLDVDQRAVNDGAPHWLGSTNPNLLFPLAAQTRLSVYSDHCECRTGCREPVLAWSLLIRSRIAK